MSYDIGLIKPLLFPSCYSDESPIGYLIRIAELNNYESFKWFIGEHRSKVSSVIHGFYYKILCKYEWTGFSENNNYKSYRELSQNYFVARGHRFCPLCLIDKPYFKMYWQLRTAVVCLEHKVWLHDFCFNCETQNSFTNAKVTSCACGEPYADLEISKAAEEVIRLQKFSLGIPIEPDIDKNNSLSFRERLDLVMFFTKWFGFRKEAVNLRDMDRARTHISNAAEVLFSGESGLTNFLKRLNESTYKNANSPGQFLTKFRCEFYEKFKQESLEPIRTSIEEYINRNWYKPLSRRNINFHAKTITQHPWIPYQAACREYDIHKSVLKNAIENHLIRWDKDYKQKRVLIYIYKPDLEDRLHRIKDYITAKEAAVILGLTKLQFSILKDKKRFEIAIPPTKGVSTVWRFSRDEILTYRDKFLVGLTNRNEDTWTFSQLLQFYSGSLKDPLVTLISAIEKMELQPIGRNTGKAGFGALVFSRIEFLAWLARYKDNSNINKMSVPSVAKLLRINQEFTYQLINQGYLEFVISADNNNKWITQENLERFNKRYVLLSALSKKMNINSRTLASYLQHRDIYTVDYGSKFKLRQKLYERKELENILIFNGYIEV